MRGICGHGGAAGAGGRSDGAAAARDRRSGRFRRQPCPARRRRRSVARHACRTMDLRARVGTTNAARSIPHQRSRGLRARRPPVRRLSGGSPALLPARHAESGPRARPQRRLQNVGRLPRDRRRHVEASRGRRIDRRQPRGRATPRDRSDDDRDGWTAAAVVAAAPADRARSDPRPPRRRGGVRLPQHRSREVPRGPEERAGSRAPRRSCRAGECGAARSRRPQAVDNRGAARPEGP